jgi:hypothetical protein
VQPSALSLYRQLIDSYSEENTMQIKFRSLLKGLISYVPYATRFAIPKTGGSNSARYCYSVWLRHLVLARVNGFSGPIKAMAELGPGDSLGVGLAAMLSGVDKYYALDCKPFASTQQNLQMLDELLQLFASRADIPGDDEFPRVYPKLTDYRFPGWLPELQAAASPDATRVAAIRRALEAGCDGVTAAPDIPISMKYVAPWNNSNEIPSGSVDIVISQAVMEHVDDVPSTYKLSAMWLRPGGLMSHTIDFKSHGFATDWNGHWTIPGSVWTFVRAKRPFAINRLPHSRHVSEILGNGCTILFDQINRGAAISHKQLAREFRGLSSDDLTASEAVVQATKKMNVSNRGSWTNDEQQTVLSGSNL